jgi:hypothetical protein
MIALPTAQMERKQEDPLYWRLSLLPEDYSIVLSQSLSLLSLLHFPGEGDARICFQCKLQPNSLSILKLLLDAAPYECSYARLLEAISDVPYEIWAARLKAVDDKTARKAVLFPVWRVIYNLKQPMEGLGLAIVFQKNSGYTLINRQKTRSSRLSTEHYTTIGALK